MKILTERGYSFVTTGNELGFGYALHMFALLLVILCRKPVPGEMHQNACH